MSDDPIYKTSDQIEFQAKIKSGDLIKFTTGGYPKNLVEFIKWEKCDSQGKTPDQTCNPCTGYMLVRSPDKDGGPYQSLWENKCEDDHHFQICGRNSKLKGRMNCYIFQSYQPLEDDLFKI